VVPANHDDSKGVAMHRELLRVAPRETASRPAKLIQLEARRKARLERVRRPIPPAAA
jgi:hypothetical protein